MSIFKSFKYLCLFFLILCGFVPHTLQAESSFRVHRAKHFFTLPIQAKNIVFIGNSITNMHEWREAFQDSNILNRGISGAISDELLNQIEAYVAHHPQKVFLMIGTNDLARKGMNHPLYPFQNLQQIVERIRTLSPQTKIYVQSVLPVAQDNKRSTEDIIQLNQWMKAYCAKHNLVYVDLWSLFVAPHTKYINPLYTYDGLHPTVKGYTKWCEAIAPYVGKPTIYPHQVDNNSNGVYGSEGMRITTFGYVPLSRKDIIVLGDEMVHGAEWQELFPTLSIKSRGIGWGYPGAGLNVLIRALPIILQGNHRQAAPQQLIVYAGTADVNGSTSLSIVRERYDALLSEVQRLAPTTKLIVCSLLPSTFQERNEKRYEFFNEELKKLCQQKNISFVDLYHAFLKDGILDTQYAIGNYLNGIGYVKLAHLLSPYLQQAPVSLTEAQAKDESITNQLRVDIGKNIYQIQQKLKSKALSLEQKHTLQEALDRMIPIFRNDTTSQATYQNLLQQLKSLSL